MNRIIVVAALALPATVLAQASARTQGELLEIDNFNAAVPTSYLNAAQCAGTAPVRLEWNIRPLGSSTTIAGTYQIYASDQRPPTEGAADVANFCATQDNATADPQVHAGLVKKANGTDDAIFSANSAVQREDVSGASIAAETSTGCSGTEGRTIYVCAHLLDVNSAKAGWASGVFMVQLAAPAAPSGVRVGEGPGSLIVRWAASTGGAARADQYIAFARPVAEGSDTPAADAPTFQSSETNGTGPVTISGLTNGQRYRVNVVAFSVGGNPSAESQPEFGTPTPVDGFWTVYENAGGREQGGCGAGGAGPFSLLALAGLLAAIRRRK